MAEVKADGNAVAFCGLYCGACKRHLSGGCVGCHENEKAGWCKIRKCCLEHNYKSCADCTQFSDPNDCKMFNNFIAKIFGLVFNSNRHACILKIKELGVDGFAAYMTENRLQSLPRK